MTYPMTNLFRTYTYLKMYQKCPRLYVFHVRGFEPFFSSKAMETGTLVHHAISAYFRGQEFVEALVRKATETFLQIDRISDEEEKDKAMEAHSEAISRAVVLSRNYIETHGKDFEAPLIEPVLQLGGVTCHPDLIAYLDNILTVVDFKTGESPDCRWLDVSGQLDLYAYVIRPQQVGEGLRVAYDIIADDYFDRMVSPPRYSIGARLHSQILQLPEDEKSLLGALNTPHLAYNCPNTCAFFTPCFLLDTCGEGACEDFLHTNYLLKGESGGTIADRV